MTTPKVESVVIATLMENPDLYKSVAHLLKPDMFTDPKHRSIAKHLQTRHKAGELWDVEILANTTNTTGGASTIYDVSTDMVMPSLFPEYFKCFHLNHFWTQLFTSVKAGADTDVNALKRFIDDHVGIGSDEIKERTFEDIAQAAADKIATAGLVGLELPTNFSQLDHMTSGFLRKQITLVVGATGHSKSLFAWNLLLRPIMTGKKVLVIDKEMTEESLVNRLIAMYYQIPLDWLQHGMHHTHPGPITKTERAEAIAKTAEIVAKVKDNLIIKSHSKLPQLEEHLINHKPDIVLIDTITAFAKTHQKPNGVNNADHITSICSSINSLAKEHNCAFIQCAQVNRATDGAVPTDANIKESSGIADNAAVIIGVRDREKVTQNAEDAGVFDVYVSKSRHGKIGKLTYSINKAMAHVSEHDMGKTIEEQRSYVL
jgi:replicative DNA helicase